MKKSLALILSGILAFSALGATVFAEEAAPVELNFEDVAPLIEEAGIEGEFVTFDEVAVQMWVPSVMPAAELTDEDKEAGYIAYFEPEDQSAAAAVMYVDVEGASLEDYKAMLAEDETVTELEDGILNGLACISYSVPENDTTSVAFASDAGYILEFTFAPMSDEEFAAVAAIMTASIMPEAGVESAVEEAAA